MSTTTDALISEFNQICSYYSVGIKPVAFEVFQSERYWGMFDPKVRTIRINEALLRDFPWSTVCGVLKHEVAHLIVEEVLRIDDNTDFKSHGQDFLRACDKIGVPPFFRQASINLTSASLDFKNENPIESAQLSRLQKLMALACSDNEFEAKSASEKIQELIFKNQINLVSINPDVEYHHLSIDFKKQRVPLYQKQIVNVLIEHFNVHAVFQTGFDTQKNRKTIYVELIGRKENLIIAEDVFSFLDTAILRKIKDLNLAKKSKFESKSFAWGFIDGFREQLKGIKEKTFTRADLQFVEKALVLSDEAQRLKNYSKLIFPRLRSSGSKQCFSQEHYDIGSEHGKNVKLRKTISQKSNIFGQLLGHRQ